MSKLAFACGAISDPRLAPTSAARSAKIAMLARSDSASEGTSTPYAVQLARIVSVLAWLRQLTVPGHRACVETRGFFPFVTSNRSVRRIILQSYS
jgi:hypothetical protein